MLPSLARSEEKNASSPPKTISMPKTPEDSYDVQTSSVNRTQKGKGKRTATFIGGGAGVGAPIGGLAGGGKGALLGAHWVQMLERREQPTPGRRRLSCPPSPR